MSHDNIESIGAVVDFRQRNGIDGLIVNVAFKIKVLNKNILEYVPISTNPDYSDQTINIMWEDIGMENYRELGLYGQYSTYYQEMIYDDKDNTLTIIDDENNEIIIFG